MFEQAPGIDWAQIARYPLATAGEFAIIAGLFRAIDALVPTLPTFCVPPLFLFLSLRSRVFSFIPASRPPRGGFENPDDPSKLKMPVPKEIKRPSWTPPGIAFPFIWITISLLRAASSTIVWRACGGKLFSAPLLVLVLHLCVGDTWNCVNNIEKRLGTSAVGVLAVLASVYAAVAVYWSTVPLAGMLLAPSALWISIASVLTWTIWKINEPREPLLPKKGEGKNAQFRLPLSAVFEK
jgi:tryptophan-rich sensory protein